MFINKNSVARGSAAGADAVLGATRLWTRGPYVRRCLYPTDKTSLVGRHQHLTLAEQLKLELWCRA